MTSPSHDSQDPRAYFIIRDLAAGLAGVFEDLRFEPLFKRHPDTVSVVALLPGDYVAGGQDTSLTLWRGHREGGGQDNSGQRLWLRIEGLADGAGENLVQAVDPEVPGLGLKLPESAGDGDSLLKGVTGMVKLLETAVPVHRSNSDTDLVFRALNDTVREGIAHGGWIEGDRPFDEEDDPVAELVQLCAESGLESVDFGPTTLPGRSRSPPAPYWTSPIRSRSRYGLTLMAPAGSTLQGGCSGWTRRSWQCRPKTSTKRTWSHSSPRSWPPSMMSPKPSSET